MKIAIVAPAPVPFAPGGAEAVWAGLYRELLEESPHDVELIKIPVRETTLPEVMAGYEAFSTLDLDDFDLVVSGKYPAWMVRHPRHVVYMLHPLRGLYDAYHYFAQPIELADPVPVVARLLARATSLTRPRVEDLFAAWHDALEELGPDHEQLTFPGPVARTLVHALDRIALDPAHVSRFLAISRTVAGRADYFPRGVRVDVVPPPSDLRGLHRGPSEYFFTASRHDAPKRLDLLIQGMRHYSGDVRLVVAGDGPETTRLRALATGDKRVELVGRVSPDELVEHYAHAAGVPFIPLDEDLGLITIEAMAAGKPVLTTEDSGGPTEFVEDGRTGVVVAPTPQSIGLGLTRLERMSRRRFVADAAQARVADITWARVVEAITGSGALSWRLSEPGDRPRLVVTSTFAVWPPRNGGQLRASHLYGALAEWFDVQIVSQAPHTARATTQQVGPHLVEHVIPHSTDHEMAERRITEQVGVPITDIVAGRLSRLTPAYGEVLGNLAHGAAAILLADPFLHPMVAAVAPPDVPVVYDAYNCEYVLKSQVLPQNPAGRALVDEVFAVERDAAAASALILTVSREDAANIRQLYGIEPSRFALAPNGVDVAATPFTPVAVRARRREQFLAALRDVGGSRSLSALALFVGSWHVPNNNAACEILQMAAEMPEVGFLLVGSHTGSLRRRSLPGNVMPVGVVSDSVKHTLLGTVDVALAPLTEGSGTNLKVVEYLAAGAPVVTTSVGARGLEIPPGVVSCVEIDAFVPAIRGTLASPEAAHARSVAGRLAVERAYDWSAIATAVVPRLRDIVGHGGPAQSVAS